MSVKSSHNSINMSLAEIEYNLSTLANTVGDDNVEVDAGFIEIFKTAINNLQDNINDTADKKSELSKKLTSIDLRMRVQKEKRLHAGKDNLLIGKSTDLTEIAKSRIDGPVKNGMNKLAETFEMQSVAGDNHCLFRSIMMGYLKNKWIKLTDDARLEELERLESLLKNLSEPLKRLMPDDSPSISQIFPNVESMLLRVGNNPETLDRLMNNPVTSDYLVGFSRMLASAYYLLETNVVLESDAKTFGKNISQYLIDMATMKKEQWGGEPEIRALSQILGIQIQVNDVDQVGKGETVDPKHLLYGASKNTPLVDILRFPGHYNLGVRK